jgi:RNA polymerase sigma-70 factor (ECF subfamily)
MVTAPSTRAGKVIALCPPNNEAMVGFDSAASWAEGDEPIAEANDAAADGPGAARHTARELSDEALAALVERIVDRSERALEELYDATSARVHGIALRITRNHAVAEEVVEDCFWQVWRQAPRFDPSRGRAMAWLLAMARSRAIDALRRNQRFDHDELPDEGLAEDKDIALAPQDLLDATRGADAVQRALALLDARARQMVSLAFFRGMTHEEIAEQERMPLGTVKSVIRRALQQLRRELEVAT